MNSSSGSSSGRGGDFTLQSKSGTNKNRGTAAAVPNPTAVQDQSFPFSFSPYTLSDELKYKVLVTVILPKIELYVRSVSTAASVGNEIAETFMVLDDGGVQGQICKIANELVYEGGDMFVEMKLREGSPGIRVPPSSPVSTSIHTFTLEYQIAVSYGAVVDYLNRVTTKIQRLMQRSTADGSYSWVKTTSEAAECIQAIVKHKCQIHYENKLHGVIAGLDDTFDPLNVINLAARMKFLHCKFIQEVMGVSDEYLKLYESSYDENCKPDDMFWTSMKTAGLADEFIDVEIKDKILFSEGGVLYEALQEESRKHIAHFNNEILPHLNEATAGLEYNFYLDRPIPFPHSFVRCIGGSEKYIEIWTLYETYHKDFSRFYHDIITNDLQQEHQRLVWYLFLSMCSLQLRKENFDAVMIPRMARLGWWERLLVVVGDLRQEFSRRIRCRYTRIFLF